MVEIVNILSIDHFTINKQISTKKEQMIKSLGIYLSIYHNLYCVYK